MADDEVAQPSSGSRAGDVVRALPALVLAVVVVVFALANTQKTEVDFVVADTRAPLFLVLLATAMVGALIASLVRFRRKRS